MGVIHTLRQVYMHTTLKYDEMYVFELLSIINAPVQRHFEQQNTDRAKAI